MSVDNKGWITIHRKLQDSWLWEEKRVFSKAEAWIDILLTVNHSENKSLVGNVVFTIKRGESILSQLSWANRWKWDKSKVRRFFKLLSEDEMISIKNEKKTTRLTVLNYDSYQGQRIADESDLNRKRIANDFKVSTNNNVNNENNENNENKKENRLCDFETFWNIYDKKVDSKKCNDKFLGLSQAEVDKILLVVNKYISTTPDKKYRKNPITWLNGKCWNDEMTTEKKVITRKKIVF